MSYERPEEKQEVIPHARFVMLPFKNKRASIEAGHEVYVDKPYIEILKHGGDINTFAVNDEFKKRYPDKWEAFEAGQEQPKVGLPLEKWPGCSRAECENLKRVNLFTMEDVAGAPSNAIEAYGMGGVELKKKANAYLAAAKDNGALVSKMEDLENKLILLTEKNQQLEGMLNSRTEPESETLTLDMNKRKPGRPKKE